MPARTGKRLAWESLVGLSVGDALGAPFEGRDFDRARLARLEPQPIARWTDDTAMAISIVEVLFDAATIDGDRLARAFGRRYEPGRGYGAGMHRLLPRLSEGEDWRALSRDLFPGGSYGNGSAMRVAPLGAFFHDRPIETVVSEAERSAEVTHAHPEALAGAAATAIAAWAAARSRGGSAPSVPELLGNVRASLPRSLRVTRALEAASALPESASLEDAVSRLGNGSHVACFDTVPLALWIAFRDLDDFAAAIRHAVSAGGDTDTIAAIVGGIVAARVGIEGIPAEWLHAVEPLPATLRG